MLNAYECNMNAVIIAILVSLKTCFYSKLYQQKIFQTNIVLVEQQPSTNKHLIYIMKLQFEQVQFLTQCIA